MDDEDDVLTGPSRRKARTIIIRCWNEPIEGQRPLLRGTIRDLSGNGHVAFGGLGMLVALIGQMLGGTFPGDDDDRANSADRQQSPRSDH